MRSKLALTFTLMLRAALPVQAADAPLPGEPLPRESMPREPMPRVLVCAGPDASMEVYLPDSVVSGRGASNVNLSKPVIGAYTLDLSGAGKGKVLEWVRVSLADNGTTVVVDQVTRGLPPTRIPIGGGTVSFDNRFGTNAICPMFNEDPEIE